MQLSKQPWGIHVLGSRTSPNPSACGGTAAAPARFTETTIAGPVFLQRCACLRSAMPSPTGMRMQLQTTSAAGCLTTASLFASGRVLRAPRTAGYSRCEWAAVEVYPRACIAAA